MAILLEKKLATGSRMRCGNPRFVALTMSHYTSEPMP